MGERLGVVGDGSILDAGGGRGVGEGSFLGVSAGLGTVDDGSDAGVVVGKSSSRRDRKEVVLGSVVGVDGLAVARLRICAMWM